MSEETLVSILNAHWGGVRLQPLANIIALGATGGGENPFFLN